MWMRLDTRLHNELCTKEKKQEDSLMADKKEEKLNISKDLLDAMLVGKDLRGFMGKRRCNNKAEQDTNRTYA